MKKISIITPSFNQGQYLEQTIDSVLSQQYPNLEYLIIDGGSTDNSVEIIKKYEKYLTYWTSEKDNGQSDAINKGLMLASGEIVNWLNSDDYYEKDTLKKINTYFSSEDILVFCGKSNIWQNNHLARKSAGTDIYTSLEKTIGGARIDQPETFFSMEAIRKMGLLNPSIHYVMDRAWWIQFLLHFGIDKLKKTDDVLVNFRIHEHSKTANFQDLFYKENINLYYTLATNYALKEADLFKRIADVELIPALSFPLINDINVVQKSIHYFWYFQACMHYAQNNYTEARKFFSLINHVLLEKEDQKEIKKIETRMNLIPVFIKKLWNNK